MERKVLQRISQHGMRSGFSNQGKDRCFRVTASHHPSQAAKARYLTRLQSSSPQPCPSSAYATVLCCSLAIRIILATRIAPCSCTSTCEWYGTHAPRSPPPTLANKSARLTKPTQTKSCQQHNRAPNTSPSLPHRRSTVPRFKPTRPAPPRQLHCIAPRRTNIHLIKQIQQYLSTIFHTCPLPTGVATPVAAPTPEATALESATNPLTT